MGRLQIVCFLALVSAAPVYGAKRRAVGTADWPSHPLLEAARVSNQQQYDFAHAAGAKVLLAPDNSTFALYAAGPRSDSPLIVTLHGSEAFATAEFFHWDSLAVERGYGLLALQWWMGKPDDYLDDDTIYALISQMLARVGAPHGRCLLHGFSRGSARSYAVTFLDRRSGQPWFLAAIANSGGAQTTYPLYGDIDRGRYGSHVFADTKWILYCGEKDPNPDVSGCPAMQQTVAWLTVQGGTVLLAIQDPNGDHGGFEKSAATMRRALDTFAGLLGSG